MTDWRPRHAARHFLESLVGTKEQACIIWPWGLNTSGYGYLWRNKKYYSASRYMCILAHGDAIGSKNDASHNCGNRKCVNPNHLRWDERKGNAADRLTHGTDFRADKSPSAKLTWDDVRQIRRSTEVAEKIAPKFGVTPAHIRRIREGTRWSEPEREAA